MGHHHLCTQIVVIYILSNLSNLKQNILERSHEYIQRSLVAPATVGLWFKIYIRIAHVVSAHC